MSSTHLQHCCRNYCLRRRPGSISCYLNTLRGISPPHHCQQVGSVTQPPCSRLSHNTHPHALILTRLGHWLLTELTIHLPTPCYLSEGRGFPSYCVAVAALTHPAMLTSNITSSVMPGHRNNWSFVCTRRQLSPLREGSSCGTLMLCNGHLPCKSELLCCGRALHHSCPSAPPTQPPWRHGCPSP